MLSETLVVLDFETTGLCPERGDRITEVGVARVAGGRVVERYQSLVNCGVRVPPYITAYTGISQTMVDDAPPVEQVMRELVAFIGNDPVVAHNATFDQRFFRSECLRTRLEGASEPFICSLRLSRRVYPMFQSHALAALVNQLHIESTQRAHRAAADAEVTAELLIRLSGEIGSRHSGLSITARLLRKIMRMPIAQADDRLARLCA